MYNNRALVPDFGDYFERWTLQSEKVRATQTCSIDLPFGDGEGEKLDVFPTDAAGAPVLVFIHGGYWRSLDKSQHSFIAPAFTSRKVCVVVPNYALCPGSEQAPVSISHIALQMTRALAWTWRHISAYGGDPRRITVAGHSAGGHLAAMLLGCDWSRVAPDLPPDLARNALSVSGLFDLEPLRRAPSFQQSLKLTPDEVRLVSPAMWPRPQRGQLYAVVGGDESPEFLRQNKLIRKAWGKATVPVCEAVPGMQHFSVLDALAEPGHSLNQQAFQLLQA
nr:alpha/beta hydrolase [Variovorax dokdonensis]